jgi:hypothetical protein
MELTVGCYKDWSMYYSCYISSATVTEPGATVTSFKGEHNEGYDNENVEHLWFRNAKIHYTPRGFAKIFTNLVRFEIEYSGLKEIHREDLSGMPNLKEIMLDYNDLRVIPDDLFVDTPQLTLISMSCNKIEFMSSKVLEPIKDNQIEMIDFAGNKRIDEAYDPDDKDCFNMIEDLMVIIDNQCLKPGTVFHGQHRERSVKMEKMFVDGKFSDFVIITDSKEFRVHKCILAANSQGFAETFEDPKAVEMKIEDLSADVVEEFLRYLYTDTFDENTENPLGIFALASKLKVPELKSMSEVLILNCLNPNNAFKVFTLAHIYGSATLKEHSFKVIREIFPERNLPAKLMEDFNLMKKIIEAKEIMDLLFEEARKKGGDVVEKREAVKKGGEDVKKGGEDVKKGGEDVKKGGEAVEKEDEDAEDIVDKLFDGFMREVEAKKQEKETKTAEEQKETWKKIGRITREWCNSDDSVDWPSD